MRAQGQQAVAVSEVHLIDCMEYMKTVPDGFFELAIVDPPYGINAGNGTGRSIRVAIEKGNYKGGDWDNAVPDSIYFDELFRISQYQIIWGGNYFNLPPSKSFVIWDKGETMYGRDFAECEFAWITPDKPAKIYKRSPNQLDRIHPTQKPVALYKWLLKNYAKPGNKIFDSHMGSQSSRIASWDGGFDFTGCELDKDYFDAGCKRFDNHIKQLKMFTPEDYGPKVCPNCNRHHKEVGIFCCTACEYGI